MEIKALFYHNGPLTLLSSMILISFEFFNISHIPTRLSHCQENRLCKEKCMPETFFPPTGDPPKYIHYLKLKGNTQK